MMFPRWLWPASTQPSTTAYVRLVRVAHWLSWFVAALMLAFVAVRVASGITPTLEDIFIFGTVTIVAPAVARGARYVVADE